jgi:hypothetical protein
MMAHFLMQAIAGAARRRAAESSSYAFSDDFESYADSDAATASNDWTTTGTPVFGYATSPLEGVRSLAINNTSTATTRLISTAGSDTWVYFLFRVNDTSIGQHIVSILASDGTTVAAFVDFLAGGAVRAKSGTGLPGDTDSETISMNTLFHVWIRHSVTEGKIDVYISLSSTRPSVPTISDSGSTSQLSYIRFGPSASLKTLVWDKLRVSASEIGNDPD